MLNNPTCDPLSDWQDRLITAYRERYAPKKEQKEQPERPKKRYRNPKRKRIFQLNQTHFHTGVILLLLSGPPTTFNGTSQLYPRQQSSQLPEESIEEHEETPLWAQYLHFLVEEPIFWREIWRCFFLSPQKKIVSPNLGQISMKTGKNGFVKKKWDTSGRKRKTKHDFNCWFTHVSTFNWKLPDKKIANKFQGPCDLRIAVTSSLWPLLAYMWTQKSENDQIQHFQQFHDSKGLVAQVVFTITLFEILKLT